MHISPRREERLCSDGMAHFGHWLVSVLCLTWRTCAVAHLVPALVVPRQHAIAPVVVSKLPAVATGSVNQVFSIRSSKYLVH
jgi:hypothetical protein